MRQNTDNDYRSMHCLILHVHSTHFMIHGTYRCTRRLTYMSVNVCPVRMYCELCIDLMVSHKRRYIVL